MNSNEDIHCKSKLPVRLNFGELLDRYFETVKLPDVDTAGVVRLTHMKILHERLLRSRLRWRLLSMAAVAACVALVFCLNVIPGSSVHPGTPTDMVTEALGNTAEYNEINVPTGQRMTLMLADGTRLIANSRSQVRYPSRFDGATRHVWASGEVYFEVAKDAAHPFIVSGNGFDVQVLGTKFCINNYDPSSASVVLVEGSVSIHTASDERIHLHPNHKVDICDGAIEAMSQVDTSFYTSWTQGSLRLEEQTLGDIAARLSTYYGINIVLDPTLKDRRLYGRLDLKSDIDGVMAVLGSLIPMEIEPLPDSATYSITPQ